MNSTLPLNCSNVLEISRPSSQQLSLDSEPVILSLSLLPAEMILLLFKFMGPVNSCVLGLTCRTFYAYHKENYPGRIYLNKCENCEALRKGQILCRRIPSEGRSLGSLLEQWMAPKYELDIAESWDCRMFELPNGKHARYVLPESLRRRRRREAVNAWMRARAMAMRHLVTRVISALS
ncbi:hypothetical protein BJ878DRAFT_529130 [Calycina marina]|uniref:F-box domain-containing protein n=1 Tax=Calycina marina TaxID=1763456 RepID=A0A9P7YUK8_9HELO|nr:hypothetical protein BJ878DRAFT_529130 [Calycina marina]